MDTTTGAWLMLPHENVEEWNRIECLLRSPLISISDLDNVLTAFSSNTSAKQVCHFFRKYAGNKIYVKNMDILK